MTFEISTYTIVPLDNLVLIGSEPAFGIDFNGQLSGVNAIHWWDSYQQGEMEFLPTNPVTGEKPPNQIITTFAPFTTYVAQAQAILEAQANPAIYYSIVSNLAYEGNEYNLGAPIVISTPNPIQPESSTTQIPPTPEDFQSLYWSGIDWVLSAFPIDLNLQEAQALLTTKTKISGANLVNEQSQIYSVLELCTASDPGLLLCSEYPTTTLANFQTTVDDQISSKLIIVQSASTTDELYSYDPTVIVLF